MKKSHLIAAALAAFALAAGPEAYAQAGKSIGEIAGNVSTSIEGSVKLVNAIAYLAGGIFALLAAFKFKAWRDDARNTPMGVPITLFVVAVLCLALPEFVATGEKTIWGGTASATKKGSDTLR